MPIIGAIKTGVKTKIASKLPNLFPASRTTFDNSGTDITSNRVQGALEEVSAKIIVKEVSNDSSITLTPNTVTGWFSAEAPVGYYAVSAAVISAEDSGGSDITGFVSVYLSIVLVPLYHGTSASVTFAADKLKFRVTYIKA